MNNKRQNSTVNIRNIFLKLEFRMILKQPLATFHFQSTNSITVTKIIINVDLDITPAQMDYSQNYYSISKNP